MPLALFYHKRSMLTLGLETSEPIGGVSLFEQSSIALVQTMDEPLQHAERVIPTIQDLLRSADRTCQAIGLISVNRGPGSFTGLRIGLAVAKGLGQALNCPVVGVEGTAMYRSLVADDSRVCVVIGSRRDLYYVRWYARQRPKDAVRLMHRDEIVGRLREEHRELVVAGSGAVAICEALDDHPWVRIAPDEAIRPSALAVARLGHLAYETDQLFELEPVYVEAQLA